jgi:DtxR family Mn-dependent transcriptional regulator
MSASTENFVKTIYQFQHNIKADTRSGSIARALGISNAAATDMARKLSDRNLINYEKYQPLHLTEEGEKMALHVIRKHRLWETFLYRTFHLSLHEIHQEAELLEHLTSDFLTEKISDFLGHPEFDPHGDPIPNANGRVSSGKGNILLSLAEPGHVYEITRISSSDIEFFEFCKINKLTMGSSITLEKQFTGSKMTEILNGGYKLLLHLDFTSNIYVKRKTTHKMKKKGDL